MDTILIVSTQEHRGSRSRIALYGLQYGDTAAVREAMHARALASCPRGTGFEPGRVQTEGRGRRWDEYMGPFRVFRVLGF